MRNDIVVSVLGGDLRQISVAKELSKAGFLVKLWGIDKVFCQSDGVCVCNDWEEAIQACDAVVLPLLVSEDGIRIHCPLLNDASGVKISKLLDLLSPNVKILGGRFSPTIKLILSEKGFSYIDYFSREDLQIKNALPTAEGAMALAMNELSITLAGAKIAVIGYGRIGKILSQKLKLMDAHVTVAARKTTDIALAESNGIYGLPIAVHGGRNSLEAIADGYDVIFNTVPEWIIDRKILEKMNPQTLIIDLASAPGGVDIQAAKEKGVRVIWALSLPGKNSPYTAGKIIAETIMQIIEEEGIGR